MSWTPFLLVLSALCACSWSQPAVTQPSSMSVTTGQTVRLPCALSSAFSVSSTNLFWYQQRPGSPPRYLVYYYSDSDKHQGSGVPARFSASKDPSSNTCHLLITGALEEDDADYYCMIWDGTSEASQ